MVVKKKKNPSLSFALNHIIRTSDFPQFHLENKFSNTFIFNRWNEYGTYKYFKKAVYAEILFVILKSFLLAISVIF